MQPTVVGKIFSFNFEIYTLNPETGETGWDIKFISVFAEDRKAAREILKKDVPHFDVVILFNYSIPVAEDPADWDAFTKGKKFRYNVWREGSWR